MVGITHEALDLWIDLTFRSNFGSNLLYFQIMSSSSDQSQSWAYRGFRARLSDTVLAGPVVSSSSVVVDSDMTVHVEIPAGQPDPVVVDDVDATVVMPCEQQVEHLNNLRTVAASWVMDATRPLPQVLRDDIEAMLMDMTVTLSRLDTVQSDFHAHGGCMRFNIQWMQLKERRLAIVGVTPASTVAASHVDEEGGGGDRAEQGGGSDIGEEGVQTHEDEDEQDEDSSDYTLDSSCDPAEADQYALDLADRWQERLRSRVKLEPDETAEGKAKAEKAAKTKADKSKTKARSTKAKTKTGAAKAAPAAKAATTSTRKLANKRKREDDIAEDID